jgi:hypothetical protein
MAHLVIVMGEEFGPDFSLTGTRMLATRKADSANSIPVLT